MRRSTPPSTPNHYDVLGVAPMASQPEIREAYKRLAVEGHPDKGGDPEKFVLITEAYSEIGNPDRRGRYDDGLKLRGTYPALCKACEGEGTRVVGASGKRVECKSCKGTGRRLL